MKNIAILGCGWLGMPLAEKLSELGYSVVGSTTTPGKFEKISSIGVTPYLIKLDEHEVVGDIIGFLSKATILIINVPPQRKTQSEFTHKLRTLIPFIEKSKVSRVLFISSTSVYGDNNNVVTENSVLTPETASGKDLVKSECLLQSDKHFETTILRFGGLIGGDRNPIKFLSGRPLENPLGPVNLIHQDDCIGIIIQIIEKGAWGEVFTGVTPFHPTRQEYYLTKAKEQSLAPPISQDGPSTGKTVTSEKLTSVLDYKFIRPNF